MNRSAIARLPRSVDGLLSLAAASYAERAPLYVLLAAGVFVACAVVQFAWPSAQLDAGKIVVLQLLELFADAFVVATIALGIGARLTGEPPAARAVLDGALARWLPVLGAMTIVEFLVELTLSAGAIGPLEDPLLAVFSAPVTWLLWGAMSLAGPVAALNGDRPAVAIVSGFAQALFLSLRIANLGRLCLVALLSVAPLLLQNVLIDVLQHRSVAAAAFWAWIPIDQIAIGPLTAVQTVFALDFARRVR